jgi:hypothetical protein
MEFSPRALALIVLGGLAAFGLVVRSQPAAPRPPAPGSARYELKAGGPSGSLRLTPELRDAGLSFSPQVSAGDRQLVLSAIADARPEARRLIALVDGLVDVSVGEPGEGAAGRTWVGGPRYPMLLDLHGAWQRAAQRGVDRLVLHELGHVVDDALLTDAFVAPLVAAVPKGWGCDDGVTGSCAAPQERFAESFAKWATGDVGIDVLIGYSIPPPSPSLEAWGRPLAAWNG